MTLIEYFLKSAAAYPDKIALRVGHNALSYTQIGRRIATLSINLRKLGAVRGDHVAIVMPNSQEFVILMLAAADLGLVLVPLSTSLPAAAIVRACQATDVKHLVAWHVIIKDLLGEGTKDRPLALSIAVSVGGAVDGCQAFERLCEGTDKLEILGRQPVPARSPYILTMTSGSTGDPKPIILTQETKINRAFAAQRLYGVTAADITLAATPLYHSLAERLVLLPLLTGGTSILMQGFTAQKWLAHEQNDRVTFSILVSSQLRQILAELRASGHQASNLRALVSSSAVLEPNLKTELLDYLHCDFHECYGTSEIAIATNLNRDDAIRKPHTVGIAAPGVEIVTLDEQDRPTPVGSSGEITCKTPMAFAGYYKRPDLTRAAMWGEFFRTGDIGSLDEDGFLTFLGRKKDIVITGGINVYPNDVEDVLQSHPDVAECAVIPVPDDRLGEVVGAAVVAKPGHKIDVRDLQRLCAKQLADFQQPRRIIVVEALPKNEMGKILKHMLVKQYGSR